MGIESTSISSILEAITKVVPEEASIAVADESKWIYYRPSRLIDLKIQPGEELKEGTLTLKALTHKQQIEQYLEKSIFGIPYYAKSKPIIYSGQSQGCVTAIYPSSYYQSHYQTRNKNFIIGKDHDCWVPIPLKDIAFIESQQGRTYLHTAKGKYTNKYNLTELERMLPYNRFIRCHRAYIINIDAINEIHPDFHSTFILMMNDNDQTKVPVSQKYASKFRRFLGF